MTESNTAPTAPAGQTLNINGSSVTVPDHWLLAVDDVILPMTEAEKALQCAEGLMTLLASAADSGPMTSGAWEFLEQAIGKARVALSESLTRVHAATSDTYILTPDPRFTERAALTLWQRREGRATTK
jgi:hypothetical protein